MNYDEKVAILKGEIERLQRANEVLANIGVGMSGYDEYDVMRRNAETIGELVAIIDNLN